MGVFWPCPRRATPARRGSSRAAGSSTPTAGPASTRCRYRPPAEVVDDEYPVWLTTGRVVSQYLSGTQTRRIGPLVEQYPEPLCEMHPRLAEQLGIADGDCVTRRHRGAARSRCRRRWSTTIRPDTVFIPYHWPGAQGGEPADQPRPRSDLEDARVQGVRPCASNAPAAAPTRPTRATSSCTTRASDEPVRRRRRSRCSSSTRAAASAARRACRRARSATRTAASR